MNETLEYWRCKKCNHKNKSSYDYCENCQSPKEREDNHEEKHT